MNAERSARVESTLIWWVSQWIVVELQCTDAKFAYARYSASSLFATQQLRVTRHKQIKANKKA